jgi:hypothetical protein
MKRTLLCFLCTLGLLTRVDAQLLVYDFSKPFNGDPSFAATGFSGSTLGRDDGENIAFIGIGNPKPAASSHDWQDTTEYYTFSITNNTGQDYVLGNLSWDQEGHGPEANPTGPTEFFLRSNADSYTTNLLSGAMNVDGFVNQSVNLGLDLANGGTLTFRIYADGASNNGGTYIIDNITFNGGLNTDSVPEPATGILMLGSALVLFYVVRRKKAAGA